MNNQLLELQELLQSFRDNNSVEVTWRLSWLLSDLSNCQNLDWLQEVLGELNS